MYILLLFALFIHFSFHFYYFFLCIFFGSIVWWPIWNLFKSTSPFGASISQSQYLLLTTKKTIGTGLKLHFQIQFSSIFLPTNLMVWQSWSIYLFTNISHNFMLLYLCLWYSLCLGNSSCHLFCLVKSYLSFKTH